MQQEQLRITIKDTRKRREVFSLVFPSVIVGPDEKEHVLTADHAKYDDHLYRLLQPHFKTDRYLIATCEPRADSKLSQKDIEEDILIITRKLQALISFDHSLIPINGKEVYPRKVFGILIAVDEDVVTEELFLPNVALVRQATLNDFPPSTPGEYLASLVNVRTPPLNCDFTEREFERVEVCSRPPPDFDSYFLAERNARFSSKKFPFRYLKFRPSEIFQKLKLRGIPKEYWICEVQVNRDNKAQHVFLLELIRELNSFFTNVTFVLLPYTIAKPEYFLGLPSGAPSIIDLLYSDKIFPIGNGSADIVYSTGFLYPLVRDVLRLKKRFAPTTAPLFTFNILGRGQNVTECLEENVQPRQESSVDPKPSSRFLLASLVGRLNALAAGKPSSDAQPPVLDQEAHDPVNGHSIVDQKEQESVKRLLALETRRRFNLQEDNGLIQNGIVPSRYSDDGLNGCVEYDVFPL